MPTSRRLLTVASAAGLAAILAPAGAASAAPGDVFGSGMTQTVFCHSDGVNVKGSRNTLEIVAHCDLLMVTGDDNVVTVTSPLKTLVVTGRNNVVKCEWTTGTKVSDRGFGNTVKC